MYHEKILQGPNGFENVTESLPSSVQPNLRRVLIIDNDVEYRNTVLDFVLEHGGLGRGVDATADVTALIQHGAWDIIVVDIEHSYSGGLEQIRLIRSLSLVPILGTGTALSAFGRVLAYELGVDGYIGKAAELDELWALARAVVRRQEIGHQRPECGRERGGYRFAGWELLRAARTLTSPSGTAIALTRTSYALLTAFLDAPGRVLSRAHLLQSTRRHEDIFDRSVDLQVLRLRASLKRGDPTRTLIRTERGLGYVFDSDVERFH